MATNLEYEELIDENQLEVTDESSVTKGEEQEYNPSKNILIQMILEAEIPTREENEHLVTLAKEGNKQAMEDILIRNGRLVLFVLKKYGWANDIQEDLLQEGLLGIRKAVEEFSMEYNTAFSTYAVFWIRQAIGAYISRNTRTIKLPNYIIERIRKIEALNAKRAADGLELYNNEQLASELKLSIDDINVAKMYAQATVSLDATMKDDSDMTYGDSIPSDAPEVGSEIIEKGAKESLMQIMEDCLDERELEILKIRFGIGQYKKPHTLAEVGDILNLSKQRVSQLEQRAINKLKSPNRLRELKECAII